MTSDVYEFNGTEKDYRIIPDTAEKLARYGSLDDKSVLRLRLLAEELICMMPNLLSYGSGKFWAESEGNEYRLHLSVAIADKNNFDRNAVLSVSSTGKNAAAKGIINKIYAAFEYMVEERAKLAKNNPYGFYMMSTPGGSESMAWSLLSYKEDVDGSSGEDKDEAWDELEKSIIAKLADDVIVGVLNGKADITVKKSF